MNRPLAAIAIGTVAGIATAVASEYALRLQADYARSIIGTPSGEIYTPDRSYGTGKQLDLLLMGDSLAAGLGCNKRKQTTGAQIARRLARGLGRTVNLTSTAMVGAQTTDVVSQLHDLPVSYAPDIAVVIIGGNDVTHRVKPSTSIDALETVISDLNARGTHVVVGLCPDLGVVRPLPQPLRVIASYRSRALASRQGEIALRLGASAVSITDVAGPLFLAYPDVMFSGDKFHPSPLGYKRIAKAIARTAEQYLD